MSQKIALGIDLGGTNFRIGVVSEKGEILKIEKTPLGSRKSAEAITSLIIGSVSSLFKEFPDIAGLGLGIPGIVDGEKGMVHRSPHHPEWVNVNFKQIISDEFKFIVEIDNDANMTAVGEAWKGVGRGLKNFVMITLGSGIGGGIICNGEIWRGDCGFAGEFGHSILVFNGADCSCGRRGCWETYASASGIKRMVLESRDKEREIFIKAFGEDIEKVTPKVLYEFAKEGNIFASAMWKKFGVYFGAGIASLVNTLGIMNIVVGGGVSGAWDFFISAVNAELSRHTYDKTVSLIKIHRAELVDKAGILGGAKCVFDNV